MKKKLFLYIILVLANISFAQGPNQKYFDLVKKGDSLYAAKDYKNSAFAYSAAFKENGWKAYPEDRYNAACSWALANYPDSALYQLNRLAQKNYSDILRVKADTDLDVLHSDKRWKPLLELLQKNKDKEEINYNKPLVKILDSVFTEDQSYRLQIEGIENKYGRNSKQMDSLWKIITKKDASNLISVTKILDKYGWLGPDVIGGRGSNTLFLVIQHSDQATQEKYLPMMREAVKNRKASSSSLALLEDRVALGQNKKQIYGSQIGMEGDKYYLLPLEDPDNVDKRRAEVGLQPIQDYINYWNLTWDVEKFKKEQTARELNKK